MSKSRRTLVLATGNRGKVRELTEILGEVPFYLKSLSDFAEVRPVEETGSTFEENAILKAVGFASQTGEISLADDSGLEVEALGNRPGVLSARFAGEDSGYDVKMAKLLEMIESTGDSGRRARFVCVMALSDPDGHVLHIARGVCEGTIASAPRGANGFGYDPIFIPEGYDRTFAELTDDVKSRVSHRSRAASLIIRFLLDFTGV